MTWNDLQQLETNKKRPETTYNNLQPARNDLKWPTMSKKQPETTCNEQDTTYNNLNIPTTSNSKQIFMLFYNMGQTGLFSNTFSTQHLIAVIQASLYRESWWKQNIKHLLSCVKCQLSCVFFTGYKIYFFLSGFCVSRERARLFFSSSLPFLPALENCLVFIICIYQRGLMMNKDFASRSGNRTTFFYYQNLYKSK